MEPKAIPTASPLSDDWSKAVQEYRKRVGMEDAAAEEPAVRFRSIELGVPWLSGFGMFKDDPLFDEWQAAIADYRQQREAEDTVIPTGDEVLRVA